MKELKAVSDEGLEAMIVENRFRCSSEKMTCATMDRIIKIQWEREFDRQNIAAGLPPRYGKT